MIKVSSGTWSGYYQASLVRLGNLTTPLADGTACLISRRKVYQASLDSLCLAFCGLEHPAVGPCAFHQTNIRCIP